MSPDVNLKFRWVTKNGAPASPSCEEARWAMEHVEEELDGEIHRLIHGVSMQKMTDQMMLTLLERVISNIKRTATGALATIANGIIGFEVEQTNSVEKWARDVWFKVKLDK